MNNNEAEVLLERIEISISVQKRVSVEEAKRSNQAVNSLANGSPLLPETQEVLCSADGEFLAAGLVNLKPAHRIQNSRKRLLVRDALQDFAKDEVCQAQSLASEFAIEVVSLAIWRATQIIDPNRGVDDYHSMPMLFHRPSEARLS